MENGHLREATYVSFVQDTHPPDHLFPLFCGGTQRLKRGRTHLYSFVPASSYKVPLCKTPSLFFLPLYKSPTPSLRGKVRRQQLVRSIICQEPLEVLSVRNLFANKHDRKVVAIRSPLSPRGAWRQPQNHCGNFVKR